MPHANIPDPLPDLRAAGALSGKRVLVRADLDVPIQSGAVMSDFRLRCLLPTLAYLRSTGARTIVIGHLGRDPECTLRPVYEALCTRISLSFVPDVLGPQARGAVEALTNGDIVMLENLRTHSEEQTNDSRFAKALAAYADLYVNESFANSHREHASMVGIPKYLPSFAGLRLREEVEYLKQALHPQHPALFILGGAKFATKQPLAQKFLSFYDSVFIGGALANDFFKAQGYEVGQSLVSENVSSAKKLLSHPQLMLPTDVIVKTERGERVIRTPKEVRSAECILDAGPDTVRALEARIREARVVLWNGPLGNFEHGFDAGTLGVAKYLADNKEEKFTIVGGGDTIAVLERLRLGEGSYSFISTGGGAMLQFLASETLPALEALHT